MVGLLRRHNYFGSVHCIRRPGQRLQNYCHGCIRHRLHSQRSRHHRSSAFPHHQPFKSNFDRRFDAAVHSECSRNMDSHLRHHRGRHRRLHRTVVAGLVHHHCHGHRWKRTRRIDHSEDILPHRHHSIISRHRPGTNPAIHSQFRSDVVRNLRHDQLNRPLHCVCRSGKRVQDHSHCGYRHRLHSQRSRHHRSSAFPHHQPFKSNFDRRFDAAVHSECSRNMDSHLRHHRGRHRRLHRTVVAGLVHHHCHGHRWKRTRRIDHSEDILPHRHHSIISRHRPGTNPAIHSQFRSDVVRNLRHDQLNRPLHCLCRPGQRVQDHSHCGYRHRLHSQRSRHHRSSAFPHHQPFKSNFDRRFDAAVHSECSRNMDSHLRHHRGRHRRLHRTVVAGLVHHHCHGHRWKRTRRIDHSEDILPHRHHSIISRHRPGTNPAIHSQFRSDVVRNLRHDQLNRPLHCVCRSGKRVQDHSHCGYRHRLHSQRSRHHRSSAFPHHQPFKSNFDRRFDAAVHSECSRNMDSHLRHHRGRHRRLHRTVVAGLVHHHCHGHRWKRTRRIDHSEDILPHRHHSIISRHRPGTNPAIHSQFRSDVVRNLRHDQLNRPLHCVCRSGKRVQDHSHCGYRHRLHSQRSRHHRSSAFPHHQPFKSNFDRRFDAAVHSECSRNMDSDLRHHRGRHRRLHRTVVAGLVHHHCHGHRWKRSRHLDHRNDTFTPRHFSHHSHHGPRANAAIYSQRISHVECLMRSHRCKWNVHSVSIAVQHLHHHGHGSKRHRVHRNRTRRHWRSACIHPVSAQSQLERECHAAFHDQPARHLCCNLRQN